MSQKLRRLLIGTVFFPALLSAGCAVRRAKPALPSNPRTASGRDFLVRIVNDSAAAQAVAHACWGKNVPQELRSLCTEMITVRGLEGELATRYLRLWFGIEAPAADQSPVPPLVISENGPKFALAFLELMIQRDKDEIADVEACMAKAIRPELTAFCQMLQRARTVEIRLMQNQLCRLREDCRLHGDRDEAAPRPQLQASKHLCWFTAPFRTAVSSPERCLAFAQGQAFHFSLSCTLTGMNF